MLRKATTELGQDTSSRDYNTGADLAELSDISEKQPIRKIAQYPRLIEPAAEAADPHRIAFYLYDLASLFHAFWNKGKENPELVYC